MPITYIHKEIQQEKVSPADCALLVGIPLDEASFHRKYSGLRDGNFAQSIGDSGPDLAWIAYARLIRGIPAIVADLEDLGVQVHRTLTPQAISGCIESKVVTLATQGRSAEFMPADIVDCDSLEQALFEAGEDLSKRQLHAAGDEPAPSREQALANYLNLRLHARMQPERPGLGASTRRQLEYIRCRAELDALYPGAFRGGAAIEFSDGFHLLPEVAALFPPGFEGIVDLTICNSLALAERIRSRCPHALAIAMGEKTLPNVRLPLYLAVIKFLKDHPGSFDNAMTRMQDFFEKKGKQ